jgi:hypothetical protein
VLAVAAPWAEANSVLTNQVMLVAAAAVLHLERKERRVIWDCSGMVRVKRTGPEWARQKGELVHQ